MRRSAVLIGFLASALVTAPHAATADPPPAVVTPSAETPPRFDGGDLGTADADDPAIWVNPAERSRSLVLGTLKDGGLDVYDLAGRLVQHIDAPPAPAPDSSAGRFNNVDILTGVTFAHRSPTGRRLVDLAVVTDRGRDRLRFYAIDPTRAEPLVDVTAPDVPFVFSADQEEVDGQATAYGLAVGMVGPRPVAFVTRRERATVAGLALVVTDGAVTYRELRRWRFPTTFTLPDRTRWAPCLDEDGVEPQFEGMVFDSRTLTLYAAQEPVGIWAVPVAGGAPWLVERVREYGVPYDRVGPDDEGEFECEVHHDRAPAVAGQHLASDAEGLTIYPTAGDGGVLLASSQGDSTFHAYDLRTLAYRGGFEIGGGGIDGVDESDGAHVVPHALGPAFPAGLLVVHDGDNEPAVLDDEGEPVDQTNFKLVSWPAVARPLGLPVRPR